jgi:hypothetical protein
MSILVISMLHEYFGFTLISIPSAPRFPALVPVPLCGTPRHQQQISTMTDTNQYQCPVVIDLISSSSNDDNNYSLSSVDSYYDSFELGIDERGNTFVKYKVITIDDDVDDASNKTTTTTSGSIFEMDLSYSSIPSLLDDPWYRERAIPSLKSVKI